MAKIHTSRSGVVPVPVLGPSAEPGAGAVHHQHIMLGNMKERFNEVRMTTFAMKSLLYFFYCESGSEYDLVLIFIGWLKQTGLVNQITGIDQSSRRFLYFLEKPPMEMIRKGTKIRKDRVILAKYDKHDRTEIIIVPASMTWVIFVPRYNEIRSMKNF